MVPLSAGMDVSADAPGYERHRPEKTLLYQLVEQYYPAFVTQLAAEGKVLPDYVHQEFEAYLKCGLLEYGFLRVQCDSCHAEQLAWAAPLTSVASAEVSVGAAFGPVAVPGAWPKAPPC